MASDFFLKLTDIEGESQDSKHTNEIDIQAFSFSAEQPYAGGTLSGDGSGRVSVGTFNFTARQSKASPKLFLACCDGSHIGTGTFTLRKAGKEQQEYSVYTLNNCIVTSFAVGATSDETGIPIENFSLGFTEVKHTYKEQKSDGTLGGSVETGWDVKQNKSS